MSCPGTHLGHLQTPEPPSTPRSAVRSLSSLFALFSADVHLADADGTKTILENYFNGKEQDPANVIVVDGKYASEVRLISLSFGALTDSPLHRPTASVEGRARPTEVLDRLFVFDRARKGTPGPRSQLNRKHYRCRTAPFLQPLDPLFRPFARIEAPRITEQAQRPTTCCSHDAESR